MTPLGTSYDRPDLPDKNVVEVKTISDTLQEHRMPFVSMGDFNIEVSVTVAHLKRGRQQSASGRLVEHVAHHRHRLPLTSSLFRIP